jgi:thioredoxin 1
MMSSQAELMNVSFEAAVLMAKVPFVVEFWAEWCAPCVAYGPVVERVINGFGDKVCLGRVNTANETALAEKYNIMSVPALLLFKNGEVVKRIFGARNERFLREVISRLLCD